jgi:release factor glutamine methyltransferase
MTYKELLDWGCLQLQKAQCPDADIDAWYLLQFLTDMSRTDYLMHRDQPITDPQQQRYERLIEQRMQHIPLQHLTGSQDFMGLTFAVNEHVLIPRQDTEVLAEQADAMIQSLGEGSGQILDLCTGSGCLLVSLLAMHPRLQGMGSDVSAQALKVARENAARHGVADRCRWNCGDLFTGISERFSLIVSNPPYIARGQLKDLMPEVIDHEPITALDGGEDGLDFYRKICGQAGAYLKDGGWLLLEIGFDQGQAVSALMEQAAFDRVKIVRDYCGKDRVVMGTYHVPKIMEE